MKQTDKLMIPALLALSLTAANCSFLQKENVSLKDKEESRKIASYRTGSAGPVQPTQKQKQEMKKFVRDIKSGKLVLSKAVILKNNEPVCGIDLKNHPRLAPPFARAAPAGHKSSVDFKKITACPKREKDKLAYVSQKFIPAGEQVALAPIAAAAAVGVGAAAATGFISCFLGFLHDKDKAETLGYGVIPVTTGAIGLAAIGSGSIVVAETGAIAAAVAAGAATFGASVLGGIAGYAFCSESASFESTVDSVLYIVEKLF